MTSLPFKIIESKITERTQFELTDGYQPTYALFYLKSGSFFIEIDGVREEMGEGDCMLLPDDIRFRRSVLNPIEFVYVKFARNPDCLYSIDIPCGRIEFKDRERFLSSMRAFEDLIMLDKPLFVEYREHLLADILFQIHFERHPAENEYQKTRCFDKTVIAAVDFIAERITDKISIADICRAVNSNASTLNHKFRRELGMSCGEYITNERMKKARHLLSGSTYNITEISQRCGYENVYYFSNAFKKAHGMSPVNYLKSMQ